MSKTFADLTADAEKALQSVKDGKCGCWACHRERGESPWHYIVCPTCGSKRCPKANNHNHACTNSNEPGQKEK